VFIRDAPLGTMPIGGQSVRRPDFDVEFDGAPEQLAALVQLLNGRPYEDLPRVVSDFVDEVARHLAEHGEAVFEIVRRGEETRLLAVQPQAMHFLPWLSFEWIPRHATAEEGARRFIRVPREKLWRVKLPRQLGGKWRQRWLLRKLNRIESIVRAFRGGLPPASYDAKAASRAETAAVIAAERRWGMLVTYLQGADVTSYLTIAGSISHVRAQALLRDHILERLNSLLAELGFAPVRVVGLPTAAEIDGVLDELQRGEIDFKEAVDRTNW
jgi:hypothetical protein